jgi:hypothetical protein
MRRKILKVKQIGLTKESGKAECRSFRAKLSGLDSTCQTVAKTAFCFSLQIEQVREKVCN